MGNVCSPADEKGKDELQLPSVAEGAVVSSVPVTLHAAKSDRDEQGTAGLAAMAPPAAKAPPVEKAPAAEALAAEAPAAEFSPLEDEVPSVEGFQARKWRETIMSADMPLHDIPGVLRRRISSENVSLDTYAAKHNSRFQRLLALESKESWEFKREEQGVRIYLRSEPGQDLYYFKGVTDVKVTQGLARILSVLLNTEERPKWDEMCIHGTSEQYYPPFYKYSYVKFRSPSILISPRDMLLLGRFRFQEDGSVVIAVHSTEYPGMPEDPNFVRAQFVEGGYIVRPKPSTNGEFTISWMGCVDPKGWIPTWVANMLAPKQALTLARVKPFF